jgi:hypothetical protein
VQKHSCLCQPTVILQGLPEKHINFRTLLPVTQETLQITLLCPAETRVEAVLAHRIEINDRNALW